MLMRIGALVLIVDVLFLGMLSFFLPNLLSSYVLPGNPVIIENLFSISKMTRENPFSFSFVHGLCDQGPTHMEENHGRSG